MRVGRLAGFLSEQPHWLVRGDIQRVLCVTRRPFSSGVRSRRPMCALEVRVLNADAAERTLSLVAMWSSGEHWARAVRASRYLAEQYGNELEAYGIVEPFAVITPLKCLLYRRIEGEDLKVKWRRMMLGGAGLRNPVWQNLGRAARWLSRFQALPVRNSSLQRTDKERNACADILRNVGAALLPPQVEASELERLLTADSRGRQVLSHGTFMLQNIMVHQDKPWVLDWENLHLGHTYEDASAMYMSILNQGRLFPHRRELCAASIRHFLHEYVASQLDVDIHCLTVSLMCRLVQQLAWGTHVRFRPDWLWYLPWVRRQLVSMYRLHLQKGITLDKLLQTIS